MTPWAFQPFSRLQGYKMRDLLRVGDAILTEGSIPLWRLITWPPKEIGRRFILRQVYRLIHKRHKDLGRKHWRVVHVRGYIGDGRFAEITWPKARYGHVGELIGEKLIVCRPTEPFDPSLYLDTWAEMVGLDVDYDIGELLEHADQWLGEKFDRLIQFDDGKRYVCSSGYGKALAEAQGNIGRGWVGIDPAWYAEDVAPFAVHVEKKAR